MAAKILIADDHPLFRGALRLAVTGAVDDPQIIEAADLDAALTAIAKNPGLEIVLLDLNMPGSNGFSGLMRLRAQHPATPVIVVSGSAEPATVSMAMQFGASGFIPKTTDIETMRLAIRAVLGGGSWTPPGFGAPGEGDSEAAAIAKRLARLTPQQLRVLTMLSDGLLNKQIAFELDVSEATVKAHVSAILQKLDVDSRTQAVIAANRVASAGLAGAPVS
jgi:DNA-binding NarL/FixJ family response regulator